MTGKNIKNTAGASLTPYQKNKSIFLSVLLLTICIAVATVASVVDKFIFPFGGELLSPLLIQLIALLIPTYLFLMIFYPNKSALNKMKSVGFHKIGAEYIFLIIFTSMLLISTSLTLNICLGGVYDAAEGFTLLGSFTAGVGEYTASYPYLAIIYAIAPALIDELMLRGLIYSRLSEKNEFFAISVSSIFSVMLSFTLAGIPAALLCALTYCFIRNVTGSLFPSVIIHLIFNLYAVFLQTNVAKYFLSSQNNALLIIIVITVWLICALLFFSESARIYKAKSERIKLGEEGSTLPSISFRRLGKDLKEAFSYRPTFVCAIISATLFVANTVLRYIA